MMKPIQEILNRIRWDKQFSQGQFEIGYYDRIEDCIIRVPFEKISFDPEDHFNITVLDADYVEHSVPLHRIKEVYKDKQLIWSRIH